MKKLTALMTIFVLSSIGCTDNQSFGNKAPELKFTDKASAEAASPIGVSCTKVVREPISRGRGSGLDGKYNEVTYYYPGFIRGDINSDGLINRDDAMIAVKNLFDPNKFKCPATADIGGYPQTLIPDGFFTSQDVVLWNNFKQSGQITWPSDVVCAFDCAIVNQQAPQ
jgi:hypothetical protein